MRPGRPANPPGLPLENVTPETIARIVLNTPGIWLECLRLLCWLSPERLQQMQAEIEAIQDRRQRLVGSVKAGTFGKEFLETYDASDAARLTRLDESRGDRLVSMACARHYVGAIHLTLPPEDEANEKG